MIIDQHTINTLRTLAHQCAEAGQTAGVQPAMLLAILEGYEESDALAAHVERIIREWNKGDDQFSDAWINRMGDIVEDAPATSLARYTLLAKAEEAQRIADELREDVSGSHFTEWLDERAAELRQQAETEH